MQGQTKLAVGIGALIVVVGAYYVSSKDKKSAQTQVPAPVSGSIADGSKSDLPPSVPAKPVEDSAHVASPAPKPVPDSTSIAVSAPPRPQPIETSAPPAAATPSVAIGPPAERMGLGSISSDPIDPATAAPLTSSGLELPPNTDRSTPPPAPVLPASAASATTKPAAATPAIPVTVATTGKPIAPAGAAPKADAAGTGAMKIHTIQAGDNYNSLALKYFGHRKYVGLIAKANPGKDARKLYVGAKVNIPAAPEGVTPPVAAKPSAMDKPAATGTDKPKTDAVKPAPGSKTQAKAKEAVPPVNPARAYTVKAGDTWHTLAQRFMGKPSDSAELYEYNKERVGGNPDLLRAGMVIELPASAKLPSAKPATPAPAPTAAPAK